MKKKTIFIYLFIVLSTFFSCKKYLEEKSNKKLVVISKLEDMQALLDDAATMNNVSTPSYMESAADDYFLPPSVYAAQPLVYQQLYEWKKYPYRYSNDWNKAYLAIYNSNVCLEAIGKITQVNANAQLWNNVKGSALFYRSFYYLLLAWQHSKIYDRNTSSSDLGIVLRSGTDFNVPSIRATVEQTYQQIIGDTKMAINLLPAQPQHVLRPSRAAAFGLLSRAYLSMGMADSAYRYADLCLQIKSSLMNYNGDSDISGSMSASLPFKRYNKETIFYTEMFQGFGLHAPYQAKIDTSLYQSYNLNDLRRTGFFKATNPYQQFKGNYTANANNLFTGIATDEIFLIRAECLARLNRTVDALADLNTLLKARWKSSVVYNPVTATDSRDALNKILVERRKELLMRGLRWIDIKRLNKEGMSITLKRISNGETLLLKPDDPFYALPLPQDIIEQTGIQQN